MQLTYLTTVAFATAALAAPSPVVEERDASGLNPGVIFTNATCHLDNTILPNPPLGLLFPTAEAIGALLGPFLSKALGSQTVNDIDLVAEDICV